MNATFKMIMALGLLWVITGAKVLLGGIQLPENTVTISFNKNIEFLGYALYIGEPEDEYTEAGKNHPLRLALDEKRMQLKDEESLLKVFELGEELPYSLFVELLTRLDELPYTGGFEIFDDIMQRYHLTSPADRTLISEIIKQINTFYKLSGFEKFWESNQAWYVKSLEEINKIKPESEWIEAMESFYEQQFLEYRIIPSLTFWSGPGFGFSEEGENGSVAYFVLGPLSDDFRFENEERLKTLAIHEFGHSFVNHLLEGNCSDLIQETRQLFDPIAETMGRQGYYEWYSCVNEHFVRAGEVLIPELMGYKAMSESTLKWNTEGKEFIYLPFIVDRLRTYRISKALSYEQSIRETMKDLKKNFMP